MNLSPANKNLLTISFILYSNEIAFNGIAFRVAVLNGNAFNGIAFSRAMLKTKYYLILVLYLMVF